MAAQRKALDLDNLMEQLGTVDSLNNIHIHYMPRSVEYAVTYTVYTQF